MTRDVLVSITGARFSEHDKEDVEMIIGGDYFWKMENIMSCMKRSLKRAVKW